MRLGVCGDRCDVCPRYIATVTRDAALLERIMRAYVKAGLRGANEPLDDLKCRGCSPENKCAYSSVRDCANGRKLENCGACFDYPCEKINEVFRKTATAREKFVEVCTPEELVLFEPAFFKKKAYLDGAAKKGTP